MKTVPNLVSYLANFSPKRSEILREMEIFAHSKAIPIIGPELGMWLYQLACFGNAQKILELGTAIGYSTIFLAMACAKTNGLLTSIEINPKSTQQAQNFAKLVNIEQYVEFIVADARKILEDYSKLSVKFDMIFMDIDQRYYHELLPFCTDCIRKNGLLIVDNTSSIYAHKFNELIYADKNWQSVQWAVNLPEHNPNFDSICMAIRN